MNKPKLVAIFAHPDDEAFGPAGTIAKYAKDYDIHLICATRGEAGGNYTNDTDRPIAKVREQELRRSAAILGVRHVHFFDYADGSICNNNYHDIATQILDYINPLKPQILMTYELRGVSGHLDHVAMSMITHYVFHKAPYTEKLMTYGLLRAATDALRDYFIYVPHGFRKEHVDETVDVTDYWDLKKRAVSEHMSQKADVSRMLAAMEKFPKQECFMVHIK